MLLLGHLQITSADVYLSNSISPFILLSQSECLTLEWHQSEVHVALSLKQEDMESILRVFDKACPVYSSGSSEGVVLFCWRGFYTDSPGTLAKTTRLQELLSLVVRERELPC